MADNLMMLCNVALADAELGGQLTQWFGAQQDIILQLQEENAQFQEENARLLCSLKEKPLPIIKIIR